MSEAQQSVDKDRGLEALQVAHSLFDSQNYSEAAKTYLEFADGAYGRAVYLRLGWMYQFGMGTEKDVEKAEYWYERGAQAGLPEGHYRIGLMRLHTEKFTEAVPFMERAAEAEYAPALFEMGRMYWFGKGVEADQAKAYGYCERAAALGHLFARRALAKRLLRGERGIWRIPLGVLAVAKLMVDFIRIYMKDPNDPRLRPVIQSAKQRRTAL